MVRFLFVFAIGFTAASGCSTLTGDLRRDLDDAPPYYEPTVGGVHPEGRYLDQPVSGHYSNITHFERRPATVGGRFAGQEGSWVSPEQHEANQRNLLRGAPSYSQAPNLAPAIKRKYKNGFRATRDDFIDDRNEGSLWASNGQTNYYFTKNKIRSVGDIITVTIEDQLVQDIGMEVKKTLTQPEVERELASIDKKRREEALAALGEQKKAAPKEGEEEEEDEVEEPEVPEATFADINLTEKVGIKMGETMMAEIVDRYPNGNYKIRSLKRVPYQGGVRMVNLIGVARSGGY